MTVPPYVRTSGSFGSEEPEWVRYFRSSLEPGVSYIARNPVQRQQSQYQRYGAAKITSITVEPDEYVESAKGHGLVRIEAEGVNEVVDLSRHLIENGGDSTYAAISIVIAAVYRSGGIRYETSEVTTWGGLTTAYNGLVRVYDWDTPGSQAVSGDFVEGVDYQVLTGTQPRAQEYGGGTVSVKYLANMQGTPIRFTGNSEELNYYTTGSFYLRKKGESYPVEIQGGYTGTLIITEYWSTGSRNIFESFDTDSSAWFYLYKTGHNPCPPGETYDVPCGQCVCTNICDGTLAGIINSIVL